MSRMSVAARGNHVIATTNFEILGCATPMGGHQVPILPTSAIPGCQVCRNILEATRLIAG